MKHVEAAIRNMKLSQYVLDHIQHDKLDEPFDMQRGCFVNIRHSGEVTIVRPAQISSGKYTVFSCHPDGSVTDLNRWSDIPFEYQAPVQRILDILVGGHWFGECEQDRLWYYSKLNI